MEVGVNIYIYILEKVGGAAMHARNQSKVDGGCSRAKPAICCVRALIGGEVCNDLNAGGIDSLSRWSS